MPEATIKYTSPKTLKILQALAEYLDFSVSTQKPMKTETIVINGVSMVRGTTSIDSIDNAEMNKIFTKNKIDAKELRSKWQRKK